MCHIAVHESIKHCLNTHGNLTFKRAISSSSSRILDGNALERPARIVGSKALLVWAASTLMGFQSTATGISLLVLCRGRLHEAMVTAHYSVQNKVMSVTIQETQKPLQLS
jgi:hypothetical protein